jgi:hypothetical protein
MHSCMQSAGILRQKPTFSGIDVLPLPALPPPEQRILDAAAFASKDSLAAARAEPALWWYQRPNITDPVTAALPQVGIEVASLPEPSGS